MTIKSESISRPQTMLSSIEIELQSMFTEALKLHQKGQIAQAQIIYEEILNIQPMHIDSLQLMGAIAYQTKNYQHALEMIGRAIIIIPNNATLYSNQGIMLKDIYQLEAAMANFDNAIALQPEYSEVYNNRGNTLRILKQFKGALDSYDKAITLKPDYPEAYNNRGIALKEVKQLENALASYNFAIILRPAFPEAYNNCGNILQNLEQFEAALASYDNAISFKPDYPEAYNNRGLTLQELMLFNDALVSYDKAISLKPDNAEAYNNRGITLQELNQYNDALAYFDKAISLKPDYAEVYCNRGITLQALKQFIDALVSFDKAILLKPDYAEVYCNLGMTLQELKQFNAAIDCYNKTIELKPDYAQAYNNLGTLLQGLQQFNAAINNYVEAISLKPDYAEVYCNLGIAQKELNQLEVAIDSYNKSIALKPNYAEAYWCKSLDLLLKGDFKNGWVLYEWRWKKDDFTTPKRNFSKPLWLGNEPLNGKSILLHSEQGFGDIIQFSRYAKSVAELGARVIMEVPAAMVDLFKKLDGIAELVITGSILPAFDYHCPLLSLPLAFKTNLINIPTAHAYLQTDRNKVTDWASRLGDKTAKRVGLVWRGSTTHKNDHNRSIILSQLLPYLPDNYEYVSLQKELRENDNATLQAYNIRHFGDKLNDFSDTAALCDLMDVIICVDTSIAHLSGALGKPTWVLLPFSPDWRWLLNRSDSVWYPSVKLYRQNAIGDWSNVFYELQKDLSNW